MGGSMWAQVSTWTAVSGTYTKGQQIKGNTDGIIVMTLGEDDNWAYNSGRGGIYANTQQSPTTTNNIPTAGGYVVVTPTKTLKLTMMTYSSQSNCNLYMYESNGTKLQDFRQKAYCNNDFGTLEAGKTYYIYGGGFKAEGGLEYIFFRGFTATTYENYTIHYVDNHGNTIKDDVVYSGLYGTEVTASESDMASVEYNENTYGYTSGNETITLGTGTNEITLVYETAEVCNYTIKYMNDSEPAVEIQDAAVVESYVGAEVTASGDKLPTYITYNDVRYKYVSGNTTLNVTGNAETDVITLVYTPAEVYTYTLNATDGVNNLKQFATGTFVEGDDPVTVYYPKAFTQGGVLYETAMTNFKKVFTGTETTNIVYSVSSCDYIFDESELNRTHSYAATLQKDFMSNGSGSRIYKAATVYTPALEGGIYTMVINAATYSGNPTLPYGIRIGSTNTQLGETEAWANGSYGAQKTVENIAVPDGASICFMAPEGSNSNVILDYITLTKTADFTVSATIGATGYATFSSTYALDFTDVEDLEAYTATVYNGSYVTMSKVTGTVAANTGLVLVGSTASIPVVASGDAQAGNLLVACSSETTITPSATGTNYVLSVQSGDVVFAPVTGDNATVAAGHAFLYVPSAGARALSIVFADEETTGIKNLNVDLNLNNKVFDLQGRRVAQPAKGLYIVNGKKVVIK